MSDFEITFTDLPPFTARLGKAPKIIRDELLVAGTAITKAGVDLSTGYAPVGRGTAKGSIYGKTQMSASSMSSIFGASAKHAWWADQGRPPGKMPPKGVLIGWHGVTAEDEFPIRRAIGRRGTTGKPFVTRAFKELTSGRAQDILSKALARILARLAGP